MAVAFGQVKPKPVPRSRPKPMVQEGKTQIYKSAIADGGKAILDSLWDGAELAYDTSFEKLGADAIMQQIEKRRQEGRNEWVSVKEAKEEWQLELDEPVPLWQALYLSEIQQQSAKHFDASLRDLSMKHGPANFVASLAGIFGAAMTLPTNWLGIGLYKQAKAVPRFMKLHAARKALEAQKGVKNAQKAKQVRKAWQDLRTAAQQTPVGIVESGVVVGAENVLFEHLREQQGVTGNKALAFGIGAGAGMFLGVAGRAMTRPAKQVEKAMPVKGTAIVKSAPEDAPVKPMDEPTPDVKTAEKIVAPEKPKPTADGKPAKQEPGPNLVKEVKASDDAKPAAQKTAEEYANIADEALEAKMPGEAAPVSKSIVAANVDEFDEVIDDIHRQLEAAEAWNKRHNVKAAPKSEPAERSEWQKIFDDDDMLEDTVVVPQEEVAARIAQADKLELEQHAERVARNRMIAEQRARESGDPADKMAVTKAEVAEEVTSGTLDTAKIKDAQTSEKSVGELVAEMKNVDISAVPAHIAWGRVLFGPSWEDDLVKAVAVLRQSGVTTPVTDIYPWMRHRKAFFGRYYQAHNWLKKRNGVYSSNMLKEEMLHMRQELIDFHLSKTAATTKGAGSQPLRDGKQAGPASADTVAKKNIESIKATEIAMPKVQVIPKPKKPAAKVIGPDTKSMTEGAATYTSRGPRLIEVAVESPFDKKKNYGLADTRQKAMLTKRIAETEQAAKEAKGTAGEKEIWDQAVNLTRILDEFPQRIAKAKETRCSLRYALLFHLSPSQDAFR